MAIKEQFDLFKSLYSSNLSRLELIQMNAIIIDMVREQVNNGRINGCKVLTPVGLEEIVDKIKEDSHLINITHPDAIESVASAMEAEEVIDDNKDKRSPKIMIAQRSINFSANVNTKETLVDTDEDEVEVNLSPNPILPATENEWTITVRKPNESESDADAVVEIVSKGAKLLDGRF